MNAAVRKTIQIVLCCLLVAALGLLLGQSRRSRSLSTCEGLRVEYADAHRFVTEEDIKAWLESEYGSYIGQRLDSVDLCRIEHILDDKSAIFKSEAYTTEDGILNVRIRQREPVLRFQTGETGFYVDDRGFIFPLQEHFTAPVPVVDGAVPVRYTPGYKGKAATGKEQEWIRDMIGLMDWIRKDKTWKEAFVQVSVAPDGDIILIPREGKERFVFGPPDHYAERFDKIGKYYEYILPARGAGHYKTVNVKYDRQIICRQQ